MRLARGVLAGCAPYIWGGVAAVALMVMAWTGGERPGALSEYVASGLMKDIGPDQIRRVELSAAGQTPLRFVRESVAAGWHTATAEGLKPLDTIGTQKIVVLLNFLHNTAPERSIDISGMPLSSFGLDPQPVWQLTVAKSALRTSQPDLRIDFGKLNPIGLSQYTRNPANGGTNEILLLPAFVGEAVAALLPP